MVLFIFTQIIFILLRKTPLIPLWVQVLAFLIECTHITITSFLMRLTPPLLLIAKYTHIHVILEMLVTTDLISVDQTLNSFHYSIKDLNYGTPLPIILCN